MSNTSDHDVSDNINKVVYDIINDIIENVVSKIVEVIVIKTTVDFIVIKMIANNSSILL